MKTIDEREMSKSLCGKCKNYVFELEDIYGTWCMHFKDIYQAIREGKITVQYKSEPTDCSVHYDLYGLVHCEGFEPK